MKQFEMKKSITLIMAIIVVLLAGCNTDNSKISTIQKDVRSENNSTESENGFVAVESSESISNTEGKLPFYEKVTICGEPYKLITYLGAAVSSNQGVLIIHYDKETKKPSSISIELDALDKGFAESVVENLKENKIASSSIHNEKVVQNENGEYYVVGDVDLDAPFEQFIMTWLIEQQDLSALIHDYKESFYNDDNAAPFEEGDNYFYHPTMELRIEWE